MIKPNCAPYPSIANLPFTLPSPLVHAIKLKKGDSPLMFEWPQSK